MIQKILSRGIEDGLAMTLTTTAAMMSASQIEAGEPFAPFNAICHMVDGDAKQFGDSFNPRDSLLGIALNCSAMVAWGVIYQALFRKSKFPTSVATGLATAAGAYVVDYHLVPKRFTPGIEKKISGKAIFSIYVVLGLTLGIMAAARKD